MTEFPLLNTLCRNRNEARIAKIALINNSELRKGPSRVQHEVSNSLGVARQLTSLALFKLRSDLIFQLEALWFHVQISFIT